MAPRPTVYATAVTPPPAPAAPVNRPWTGEEQQALSRAIADVRAAGRSRTLPSVLVAMGRHLGYALQDTAYNGFGSARAMFDLGRTQGILRYGPWSGPNPTVYLPDEKLPDD